MINFKYNKAANVDAAINALSKSKHSAFIAGGTNLIDLMKRGVTAPQEVVDINALPLKEISNIGEVLFIGALATNKAVSEHPIVLKEYPLLALALTAGASPQLRNMATVGGNIMQRTRCTYFYDTSMPCNKRLPGSGCSALSGYNRMHAIFGGSESCIAVHPSDMCVALSALEATVVVRGLNGAKRISFADFHRLPGDKPEHDNALQQGDLIMGIELLPSKFGKQVHYLKIRDRASYAFAVVSIAVGLKMNGNTINEVKMSMGGVAHKPWRLFEAENFLKGKNISDDVLREAALLSLKNAKSYGHNNFKIKLSENAIVQAITLAAKAK